MARAYHRMRKANFSGMRLGNRPATYNRRPRPRTLRSQSHPYSSLSPLLFLQLKARTNSNAPPSLDSFAPLLRKAEKQAPAPENHRPVLHLQNNVVHKLCILVMDVRIIDRDCINADRCEQSCIIANARMPFVCNKMTRHISLHGIYQRLILADFNRE